LATANETESSSVDAKSAVSIAGLATLSGEFVASVLNCFVSFFAVIAGAIVRA